MPVNTNITIAAAKTMLDVQADLMDAGTGANPRLRIYSGTQPDSPDDAVGTGTLLCEIDLGTAAVFSAATTGTGTLANTATCTASAILPKTQTSATASGTAAWFRAVDKAGNAVIDGSVGTATADMILDNTSINAGQTVKLNSWKLKLPKE